MKQTENYQLNQWEKDDRIQMEDFNSDNAKIDAAIKAAEAAVTAAAQLYFGTYAGNNASSRDITLGFTPKALIVTTSYAMFRDATNSVYGGIAGPGYPCTATSGYAVQIIDNGFRVFYNTSGKAYTNNSGYTYYYIAVK